MPLSFETEKGARRSECSYCAAGTLFYPSPVELRLFAIQLKTSQLQHRLYRELTRLALSRRTYDRAVTCLRQARLGYDTAFT